MRWFRIRTADIAESNREMFERFGASVVGTVLAGGLHPTAEDLGRIYDDTMVRVDAAAWLTEQYHRAERRETWLITMEAAITLFVFTEVVFSILGFFLNAIPSP
jgi:hypothetical protein